MLADEWAGPGRMSRPPRDLTPLPDLLHDAALAGPVRTRRPVYTDLLPPCNAACPAGENIQAYLASTRAGEHERARRQLTADNPFPAIYGRVCYHPCENSCNRAELIEASEDADLLIVGSRGARGFTRLMMGSVSSQVSHHAHCPVVIVPGNRR